jgi:hypothetical protein
LWPQPQSRGAFQLLVRSGSVSTHYRAALPLADRGSRAHPLGMFVVSEADAIRPAFEQHGELSAAVALRRAMGARAVAFADFEGAFATALPAITAH